MSCKNPSQKSGDTNLLMAKIRKLAQHAHLGVIENEQNFVSTLSFDHYTGPNELVGNASLH